MTSTVSFHHWEDQRAGLAEVGRVLAPAGVFALTDLHAVGYLQVVYMLGRRRGRMHTKRELAGMLGEAGLRISDWAPIFDPVLSGRRQAPSRWRAPLTATCLLAAAIVGATVTSPGAAAQASAGASQPPSLAIPAAEASTSGIFGGETISGNPVPCTAQNDGVRVCHGTYNSGMGGSDVRVKSFDGVPLEVYVILPPAPGPGPDGPYPLVVQSHGWASQAGGINFTPGGIGPSADAWAKQGYAVLQLTARGLHTSCGSPASQAATPGACTNGYIRLDDERYEARDIQYTAGLLADAGLVYPDRIAATGPSYGGGVSLELATLKDRVMNQDGTLSPWKSPDGTPMRLAAAAPEIPWSDLAYSILPNGRTLDDRITPSNADTTPIGVEKQSFFSRQYAAGLPPNGYYSTTDPQANVPGWYGAISAGEPYETNPLAEQFVHQLNRFHSPYYLLDGTYGTPREAPAPMLIANGFTDDMFPVDEALRYYNLERALYPSDPVELVTVTSDTSQRRTSLGTSRCCRARSRPSLATTCGAPARRPSRGPSLRQSKLVLQLSPPVGPYARRHGARCTPVRWTTPQRLPDDHLERR